MNAHRTQLRDALHRRLDGQGPDSLWPDLHAAGVLGLRVPEHLGGQGLPAAETEPVFDVLGDLCVPAPYLETAVIAAGLLSRLPGAQAEALLGGIAEGRQVAVAGFEPGLMSDGVAERSEAGWSISGVARVVVGGMDADALLVLAEHAGELALFRLGDDWRRDRRAVPTIDGRMAADITLSRTSAVRLPGPVAEAAEATRDEAIAAICIEAAAAMRRLVRDTAAYAKQREQFGKAIASFQVVQHHLVDLDIQARRSAAIARRAMAALDGDRVARGLAVSAAKVTICRAGRRVGQGAVQLHGGMGMTQDLPVGRLFKRLTVIEAQLGSADHHLRRHQRLQVAASAG